MHSSRQYLKIFLVIFSILAAPVSVIAAQVVDINRADSAAMIENWKGIGEKKARAIINYRKSNGPFSSVDDLANVKGIGEGLIKNNRKYMSVSKGVSKATANKQKSSTAKTAGKETKTSSDKKKKTTNSSAKKSDSKKPDKKTDSNTSTKKQSTKKKSTSKKSTSKPSKKKKCKSGSKDKDCKAKKTKKKKSTT